MASGAGKGKGVGKGRAGDAAAAGDTIPGESVTSSFWISEDATVKDPAEAAKPAS